MDPWQGTGYCGGVQIPPENSMAEDCPNKAKCPLFPHFSMQASLAIWQHHYCDTEYEKCERHKRVQRGEEVPERMLPNGRFLTDPSQKAE